MVRAKEIRRVTIPRYLQVELEAQARELGISTAAYTARLLEEGAGVRDMPFSWRHVGEARRNVQLAQSGHLEYVSGTAPTGISCFGAGGLPGNAGKTADES